MLWEFIHTHTYIHFYLILISLPPYLLNKHTVNHIVSKELCMGRACKSKQHGNIHYRNTAALHCILKQAQREYKSEGFLPVDAI